MHLVFRSGVVLYKMLFFCFVPFDLERKNAEKLTTLNWKINAIVGKPNGISYSPFKK